MANETTPYISRNPGDVITAENWNDVQVKVKEDMQDRIQSAKEQIKKTGVDRADNADKFDNKTPKDWTDDLDGRYAPKVHDHEGADVYRRYFLELETRVVVTLDNRTEQTRLQPAVIIHNMGRNPVVQVYELLDLPIASDGTLPRTYKFCFCGPAHAEDLEALDFKTKSWDERHWGDPIDVVIENLIRYHDEDKQKELKALFQDSFTLNAWLTNLEKLLFEPGPAQYHFDMGDVYRTPWVKTRGGEKVEVLRDNLGEWPPRFVYRPRLINFALLRVVPQGRASDEKEKVIWIDICHLNLNEVEIAPGFHEKVHLEELHLMVLLRA